MQGQKGSSASLLIVLAMTALPSLAQQIGSDIRPVDPKGWYWLGRKELNRHEFEKARKSARAAIELDAQYADAYRLLGEADRELEDYDGAYRAWLQASKLNPLDPQVPYYLGRLFYEANQFNESAAWLREALRLSPGHFAAMTYLGLNAEAMGMDETAEKLYRPAIEESKSQSQPFALAFLSLAKLVRKQGDESGALRILEEGERQCPEAHLLATLGAVLASANQISRAKVVLRRAIEMDPSIPEAHYRLSLLLNAEGSREEARTEMELFRKTKAAEPQNKVLAISKVTATK
jgi:tetratricopeptide (TPR) repeat protein